jgi:hypothetical protein
LKAIPWLAALLLVALGAASARAQPALLYLQVDRATRTARTAVATAAIAAELQPLLAARLEQLPDIRDARVTLRLLPAPAGGIAVAAEVTALYRYLPALEQWAYVTCSLEAVLRLTSSRVGDARIELTSPDWIARRCTAPGGLAAALGDYGSQALTAMVNAQLGRTPWSRPVRELLDGREARQAAARSFGISRLPDDTVVRLASCRVGSTEAVCAEIRVPR